ncbi:MAG: cytochrome-c peroxidase [Phycisphaeraceae bacterium]
MNRAIAVATFTLLSLIAVGVLSPAATVAGEAKPLTLDEQLDEIILEAFKPGVAEPFENEDNKLTQGKIDLGRMLFYEPRLSKNQQISCNSCHQLDKYGVDGTAVSTGHKNQKGGRNAPTVYNAAGHFAQFWDGRAETVEEQAKGPVLNPIEMAMPSPEHVLKVLHSIPGYEDLFRKAFPDEKNPVTYDNLGKAIGAFERKLVTPSRFDAFINGDRKALTDSEKQGMITFVNTGCIACHSGPVLGGKMFQKLGLVTAWPHLKDLGRFEVTKKAGDRYVFKVPSLRNIARTGPYLHDGTIQSLDVQVRLMARHQLSKELTDDEVKAIVTFLNVLTGELPTEYIRKPKLPESGPDTPEPIHD